MLRAMPKSPKKPQYTAATKCSHCPGTKCCTYITQKIPGPRSIDDFDHLAWQLAHDHIQAYKDSDGWYLLIATSCGFLQPDGQCGIYASRPQLCRDYSNDFCEFDAPAEEGFDLYFRSYEELDAYCRKRFKRWDRRFTAD